MRQLIPAFLLLCALTVSGQQQQVPGNYDNGTNLNVLYRNEASGRLFASTRGFGASFRQAKHVTQKTRSYYEIELQSLRHPKEAKIVGDGSHKRRYVYGKVNSVALLRGAIGLQNILYSKGDHKAVEVRYAYSLGPTLALMKPYYVKILHSQPGALTNEIDVKFDAENYSPDSGRVQGRSEFVVGLNELRVLPGATAKFNLSFEYAPYTNLIRALETGISVDYFPKELPLMAQNPAENVIITIHLGFVFGRKWF
jgi:hypothetical protein